MELSIYSYVFLAMNCIQYTKPELNLVLALVNLPASDSCLVVTTWHDCRLPEYYTGCAERGPGLKLREE